MTNEEQILHDFKHKHNSDTTSDDGIKALIRYSLTIGYSEGYADGRQMETTKQLPTYYVTSNGDEPNTIRFSFEAAVAEDDDYIDAFDKDGNKVESYKRVAQGQYTTDF